MKKGMLITFEGIDGSGKTTQIEMIKEYFNKKGFEVIITREPGGTKISEKIRKIILDNDNKEMGSMCEALLYAASRAQLVEEVIKPALNEGKVVICDRFIHSSLVYQGIARGLGIENIEKINNAAISGLKINLTFMLDIPYDEGLNRKVKQKKLDRLENGGNEFHKKVYEGYTKIIDMYDNIKVIDANRNINEIHKEILTIIKDKIEEAHM